MTNFNELIQKAYEIKNGTASYILATREAFRAEKSKVRNNRNLSEEGKLSEYSKVSKAFEEGFLSEMKNQHETYQSFLNEGRDAAEKALTAALPPVSEQKQKLFDLELKRVEGQVAFALGTNQAMNSLESLMQHADEPILAQQALEKLLTLSSTTLALAGDSERAALKQRLGNLYQQLDGKAQVEGAAEAREVLTTINAMKGADFAVGHVQSALQEISGDTAKYVNKPSEYFKSKEANNGEQAQA